MPAIFDIDLFLLLDVMSPLVLPSSNIRLDYHCRKLAFAQSGSPHPHMFFLRLLVKPTIISDGHQRNVTAGTLVDRPNSILVLAVRPDLPTSYLRRYPLYCLLLVHFSGLV